MQGRLLGFIIWLVFGCAIIGWGIYNYFSKKAKPFGFWANAEMFPVEDVRSYNRALGRLWCVFGIVFILLGLPMLSGQNSPWIILSILGVMAESIAAMAIYVTVIEKKYRKK